MSALLEIRNLSKTFPGQRALDSVSFDVEPGEVFALVGQNGSGKSTLIKILSGFHRPDPGGEVLFAGRPHEHGGDRAMHFIHQDLGLIPTLSTVENLSLGRRMNTGFLGRVRWRAEAAEARRVLADLGARFDVNLPVARLEPAERTLVAIARALQGWGEGEQLLVLDEPTAALHQSEAEHLFTAVRDVSERRGAGVIFVSHRLEEVLAISQRIGVLRDGKLVMVRKTAELNHDDLVTALAGRAVEDLYTAPPPPRSEVVLSAEDLRGSVIAGVDLELRAGEVLGVTGILGSGREEIAELLFGGDIARAGTIKLAGKPLPRRISVAAAIKRGLAFVPADRPGRGVILTMAVGENVTLPRLGSLWRRGRLSARRERGEVGTWIDRVGLSPPRPERKVAEFSGGNQQKAVLAKWLRTGPKVLLLDEPTQGVDVAAKATIYRILAETAADGTAILISSAEAKDLTEVCDRVLVLRDGRLVAELSGTAMNEGRVIRESLGSADPAIEAQPTPSGGAR